MVGKYRAYPEYRDSGVEWLGEIPATWKAAPLKYLALFSGGGTPSKENPAFWGGDIPWVSPKDMKSARVTSSIDKITELAVQRSATNLIDSGAVLMVVRSGILQHSIPVAMNDVPVTLNQDMKALQFQGRVRAQYAMYVIAGNQRTLLLEWSKQGATVESIEHEFLANSFFPVPSLQEQDAVVAFLDHETTKIDTLIEKQQQLIKLLKEKRQAVISHAVTKGLNPNAPMKDSGVEWLGEVPAHWVVTRYKFCTSRVIVGIAEAATHAYADSGTAIIRSTNVREDGLDTSNLLFIKDEFAEEVSSKYLYENDIVTVRTGYPGVSAVVPKELDKSHCFTNLVGSPLETQNPFFLNEFLNCHIGKAYFDLYAWGSAQRNISVPILQDFPIAYPSLEEQELIVKSIGLARKKYDRLVKSAELSIELMQERRTALISAAVTGKIDVRDWQPPASADATPNL